MRKHLIFVAAVIVTLAACTKTEITFVGKQDEIAFRTINSIFTKAGEAYDGTLGVQAYNENTTSEQFGNTLFSKVGGEWKSTPPQYWPGSDPLHFTIYGPYTTASLSISKGKITHTVTEGEDFLFGAQVYRSTKTDKALPVHLKHAMCAVKFNAVCDQDDVVTIKSITLKSAAKTGEVTITYTDNNLDPAYTWTKSLGDVAVMNSSAKVASVEAPVGNELLLVPRNSSADETGKGDCVIVYQLAGQTNTLTKTLTLAGNWDRGVRYNYHLKFASGQITFDVTVDPWDEVGPTDLEML